MPRAPHIEKHFTAGLFVRDVVIGMADGLTVPFALAAGLSGAVQDTKLIVVGGLADSAGVRSIHSHRCAAAKAPDRMLWMPRIVLAFIG